MVWRVYLVSLLCVIVGCAKSVAPPVATGAANDDVRLEVLDYDGIQQLIASKAGRVVVMDAWSTSCVPCVREFPNLVALHKRYGPDRLACVSLSFDFEGIGSPEAQKVELESTKRRVLAFLREQNATFDNVLSADDSDTLYRKLRLASVPAVFVYDPRGHLVKRFDNEQAKTKDDAFTYADVGRLVEELLKTDNLLKTDSAAKADAATPP